MLQVIQTIIIIGLIAAGVGLAAYGRDRKNKQDRAILYSVAILCVGSAFVFRFLM